MRSKSDQAWITTGLLCGMALLFNVIHTPTAYAEVPQLRWNTMETTEKTEAVHIEKAPAVIAQVSTANDYMNTVLTSMQQQLQQTNAMILAAMQQPKTSDNSSLIATLQQQQQQFMSMLLQMQQQQQQQIMMLAASMQAKPDPSAVQLSTQQQMLTALILKMTEGKTQASVSEAPETNGKITEIKATQAGYTPIEAAMSSPEKATPLWERKRLAPPEENEAPKSAQDFIKEAVQDGAYEGYYQNSMAVFEYTPTALYKIYCKEGYLSVIRLQPGEVIQSINGGDSTRWMVDVTQSGSQAQIILKPTRGGIDTNFVIVTDKHSYQIQANTASWYNPIISWNYPQELKATLLKNEQKKMKDENEMITLGHARPEDMNFNYKIRARGEADQWKPKTVFDTGGKVYIKMTEPMKNGTLPALILRDENGKAQLVNYRIRNDYYIVDRLFKQAELRLGSKDYVRIERANKLPTEE